MIKLLLLLLFTANLIYGQTPVKKEIGMETPPPPVFSSWKLVDKGAYTIEYPYLSWTIDLSGQLGTSLILYAPLDTMEVKLRANINVMIQDVTGMNMDLDKYTELSEGQVKSMMKNAGIKESKRIKNNGKEYHKIIFTADQKGMHLQFEQYYFVVGNKAYVLTYTNEQSRFENLKDISEQIFNTFKVKI